MEIQNVIVDKTGEMSKKMSIIKAIMDIFCKNALKKGPIIQPLENYKIISVIRNRTVGANKQPKPV